MNEEPTAEEARAVRRVGLLHLIRLGSLGLVLMGFAIANDVLPAPYPLSWAFGIAGLATFFFAPPLLARRWKREDRGEP